MIFYNSSKHDYFSTVAKVNVTCGEISVHWELVDGLASVHHHEGFHCIRGKSTITITNVANEDVTYWGIIADHDRTPIYS